MSAPPNRRFYITPGRKSWPILKEESEVLDYEIDFSRILNQTEGVSAVSVESRNVNVDSSSISGQIVTLFLSGGSNGTSGYIDVLITTDNSTARKINVRLSVSISNNSDFYSADIWGDE